MRQSSKASGGEGEWSHLWSSRGPSSLDRSCRSPSPLGKLRVRSTGPCRRPWGSRILVRPNPRSSGTLPGRTPLGLSTWGPGSPLHKGFQQGVRVRHCPPAAPHCDYMRRSSQSSANLPFAFPEEMIKSAK